MEKPFILDGDIKKPETWVMAEVASQTDLTQAPSSDELKGLSKTGSSSHVAGDPSSPYSKEEIHQDSPRPMARLLQVLGIKK